MTSRLTFIARTVLRALLALTFVAGGVSHVFLGSVSPQGYAAFGETALIPGMSGLWAGFVMPNVRALTIALAVLEIFAGVGLTLTGRAQRVAAAGMCAFYAFLVVLGSGFPTARVVEDVVKNRAPVLLLALLTWPFVSRPDTRSLWAVLTGRPRRSRGR